MIKKIFVTGGGGYVGSSLVDKLVEKNYSVSVLDLFIYGQNVFSNPDKINIIKWYTAFSNIVNNFSIVAY